MAYIGKVKTANDGLYVVFGETKKAVTNWILLNEKSWGPEHTFKVRKLPGVACAIVNKDEAVGRLYGQPMP